MVEINRAQFLRGDWTASDVSQRPPWSIDESNFVTTCRGSKQCGDCITACPEKILISGRGSFPVVDFNLGGCTFCGKCVEACPVEAFDSTRDQPWALKANIKETCVSMKGVECRSCGEVCETEAINFRLVVGGVAEPVLDIEACTGCGECIGICPVDAISTINTGGSDYLIESD